MTDPWEAQREALGAFIREQRKRANLSLRQLAELTSLSNPYLSQVERGLHQPSVRVLKALSGALNVSAETLPGPGRPDRRDDHRGQRGYGHPRAERPGHRAGHRRGPTPRRRPEGRPDRRLPQHARLGAPRARRRPPSRRRPQSPRASRRHHVPQPQQRRGHPVLPAGRPRRRSRDLRDRGIDVPGQPAVRRGVGPHVDHDRSAPASKRRPDQPRPPRRHQHLGETASQPPRSTVREWHTVTVASRAISNCATGLPTTAEHHRPPPAQRHLVMIQKRQHRLGGRREARQPGHQPPQRKPDRPVHVLGRIDETRQLSQPRPARQRRLQHDAMDQRVSLSAISATRMLHGGVPQPGPVRLSRGQVGDVAGDAHLGRGPRQRPHVPGAGLVAGQR